MKKLSDKNEYTLEERTAKFSEDVIDFVRTIKQNNINIPVISQLIRSATSIGANYCKANGASSKKDFQNKIYICKKECNETKYWLRILAKSGVENKQQCRKLWQEAHELTLIFTKIASTLKNK